MSGGSSVSSTSSAFNGTHSRVLVRLIVGNTSEKFPHPTPLGHTHRWTVYVKAVGPLQFTDRSFIKRVAFVLHESFENPTRVVKEPPFELSETGYGCFVMPIKIHFAGVDKTITINHELILSLEKFGEYNIEHKVELKDPTPEFYALVQKYCPKKIDKEVAKPKTIATKSQPSIKAAEKRDGPSASKPNSMAKEKELSNKKANDDKKQSSLKTDLNISSKTIKSTPTPSKKHPKAADESSGNISDTSTSTTLGKDSSEKSLSRDIPSPAPRYSAMKISSTASESSKKSTKSNVIASMSAGIGNEMSIKKSKKESKIVENSKISDELPGPSTTSKESKKPVLSNGNEVESSKKKKHKKRNLENSSSKRAGEETLSDRERERIDKEAREKIAARLFEDDIPPSTSHQNLYPIKSYTLEETTESRKKPKKKAKDELLDPEEMSKMPKLVAEKKRETDADPQVSKYQKFANAEASRKPKDFEKEKMKKLKESEKNTPIKRQKTSDGTKIISDKSMEMVGPKIVDNLNNNQLATSSVKKKSKKRPYEEIDAKIERKSLGPTPPLITAPIPEVIQKRKLMDSGNVKTEPNSPCRVPTVEFSQRPHSAISLAPPSKQTNGSLSHHSLYSGISPSTSSTPHLQSSVRGENGVEFGAESTISSSPASEQSKSHNEYRLKALSRRMSVIDSAEMMLKVASALIENDPTAVSIDASHNMDFDLNNLKEQTIGMLEELFDDFQIPSVVVENGISRNHYKNERSNK